MDVNSRRWAHGIGKWIPPVLAAGVGLIVVNLPGIIHVFLWPEWEWGDWRGWVIGPSYLASPILVWYAIFSVSIILFSRWSLARTASVSLLLYLAVGTSFMAFMSVLPGLGGTPVVFYLHFILAWPSWSTWLGTCALASNWCFLFD